MTATATRPILESWTDPSDGLVRYRFTLYSTLQRGRSAPMERIPPRTKKNSQQAVRTGAKCRTCQLGMGPAKVYPSQAFREYQAGCKTYIARHRELKLEIARPFAMKALVYRDANRGDFDGFMQALGDVLQECKVILNDRLIVHRDGSRLLKDADNPRVELTITVLGQEQLELANE